MDAAKALCESDDVRGGISFEDQNFFVGFDEEGTPTDADRQRFLGISTQLKLLVEKVVVDFSAAKDTEGLPGKGMLEHAWNMEHGECMSMHGRDKPSPARLEKLKAAEGKWRKITQRVEFLLQIGVGDDLLDMMDSAWWHLANTILKQKDEREEEAQRIVLAQLSKSVAGKGPYSLNTAEKLRTLARSIGNQGSIDLCVSILRMANILLKNGEDKDAGWKDGLTYLDQLRVDIVMILQENVPYFDKTTPIAQEVAVPFLRELVDVLRPRAEQGQHRKIADTYFSFSFRLGFCLVDLGVYSEAEEVLDRALRESLELFGIKTVEQRLEELQAAGGMSDEDLAAMREAGLPLPVLTVKDVPKMMEKTFLKALLEHEVVFSVMGSLGECLIYQQHEHPEKLPRAEWLSRWAFAAKLQHPDFGPEDGGTLKCMSNLRDALAGQHKYVEALSINAKATSIRLRKYPPGHSALQASFDAQRGISRQQADFRAKAEKILGPRSTWSDDEDGRPASIMYEKTIQDAAQMRAGSSTQSQEKRKIGAPGFQPIGYDAADRTDINWAALMVGCGVIGLRVVKIKKKGKKCIDFERLPFFSEGKPVGDSKGGRCWGSVVALMYQHLALPARTSNMDSRQDIKFSVLMGAMSWSETKEVLETMKASMQDMANGSREMVIDLRGEDKKNQQPEEQEVAPIKQEAAAPIKRTKPKRVCLACGTYGAKRKCSRCHQAYFCDHECLARGWKSFHKASCVPREK